MKLPRFPLPWRQIFIVALVYLAFKLTLTDFWAVYVIAKSPSGESVVALGTGIEALLHGQDGSPSPASKHPVSTVEVRNASGWPIAKFRPRFAPNDYAYAEWTEKLVLVSSADNGECPDFRVFDRKSGAELDNLGDEARALPRPLLDKFDPCVLGRKETGASSGKASTVEKTRAIR